MATPTTATCNNSAVISREKRTVILIAPERNYSTTDGDGDTQLTTCTRVGGFEQLLVYDAFNPVEAEFDTIALNRARNSLAPEGFAVGIGTQRLRGTTYVSSSGYPNIAPVWTKLLRAAGWSETRYTENDNAALATDSDITTFLAIVPTATKSSGTPTRAPVKAMENGKYYYKLTATQPEGETIKGAPNSAMGSDTDAGGCSVAFAVADLPTDYIGINIYRTRVNAANSSTYYLVDRLTKAEVVALTTTGTCTYIDGFADNQCVDPAASESATEKTRCEWQPVNENHDSMTVWVYLDGRLHQLYNLRGTLNFSADSGQPIRAEFDCQAKYADVEITGNVATLATPGFPNRAINITASIKADDTTAKSGGTADFAADGTGSSKNGQTFTPVVKSFSINLGTTVSPRLDANATEGILEYLIVQQYEPRLMMEVEVEKNKNRDWIKAFKDGMKFNIILYLGPKTSGSAVLALQSDTDYDVVAGSGTRTCTMQIATAPRYGENNGVRTYQLEFVPVPGENITDATKANFFKFTQFTAP